MTAETLENQVRDKVKLIIARYISNLNHEWSTRLGADVKTVDAELREKIFEIEVEKAADSDNYRLSINSSESWQDILQQDGGWGFLLNAAHNPFAENARDVRDVIWRMANEEPSVSGAILKRNSNTIEFNSFKDLQVTVNKAAKFLGLETQGQAVT